MPIAVRVGARAGGRARGGVPPPDRAMVGRVPLDRLDSHARPVVGYDPQANFAHQMAQAKAYARQTNE